MTFWPSRDQDKEMTVVEAKQTELDSSFVVSYVK